MLARGSAAAAEPSAPPPPTPVGTDPVGGASAELADPDAPPADMVHVEPTETWEDQPRDPTDLMDLGADAQAQGHAMGLKSVANRLAAIAHDLDALGYDDQATSLLQLIEWSVGEHNRIMGELEQRGRERRGEQE